MARKPVEPYRLLFLGRKTLRIIDRGREGATVDHAPVYLRLMVHDHVIIGKGGKYVSFKSAGLM